MGTPPIKIPIQAVDETSVGFQDAQASVERFAQDTERQLEATGQNVSRSFYNVSNAVESAMSGNIPTVRSLAGAVGELGPELQAVTGAATTTEAAMAAAFSPLALAALGAGVIYLADKAMPSLTDALYGFGEAQKEAFAKSGQEYDKFVDKLKKLRDLQRQVQIEALSDPIAKARLVKGFATDDLAQKQGEFNGLKAQLDAFNAETERRVKAITGIGFSKEEAYSQGTIAERVEESRKLTLAVGNLAADVQILGEKSKEAGIKLGNAIGKEAADNAKKYQTELQKAGAELDGIRRKIDAATLPKTDLIEKQWQETFKKIDDIAQKFPQALGGHYFGVMQAASRAMNAQLDADTKKVLDNLDKEFQQFIREHKFSELLGGAPGTQAGAIGDIMSATSKPTWENLPVLRQVQSVTKELFTMNDVIKATGRSFNDMFRGIALGTVEGGNAWENLKRVAVSAIAEIIGKLISLYIMQKLTGMFFAGPGNGTVANLPLNKANPILFPTIPGFAGGGDYAAGMPRIVGENGPELDIPRTAGTIIPNGKFGGDTYNVNVVNPGSVSAAEIKAMVIEGIKISQAKTLNTIRQKAARS